MRDDCVVKLAETWFQILKELSGQYPALGNLALKNIRHYVSWIDVQLIVNDNYVNLFFQLLEAPDLRERVCQCLEHIVVKGMPFEAKHQMIRYLRVLSLIANGQLDDVEYMIALGGLLNSVG